MTALPAATFLVRAGLLAIGAALAAAAWTPSLRALVPGPFSSHMTTHMLVVAGAAPLLALGLARSRADLALRAPRLFSPIAASVVELVIVWGYHTPLLHSVARGSTAGFVVEQALFFGCGLYLWLSSVGADASAGGNRAAAGVFALLLTSMHMTLLGALLALAPRPLFGAHHDHAAHAVSAIADQHVGGAVMLVAGAVVYLAGGVALAAVILRRRGARVALHARPGEAP